jgi:predicted DNA-binding transcriptional regulator YafY
MHGVNAERTSERVLRLLGLLQRRPSWTAADLAERLGVTERSVRRDVQRLRNLGYPVHSRAGAAGGYQLGAGSRLPPLLLDDEEAIATAVSLRLASAGTVTGTGEAALRTLAKLDQVMPPRLRAEVRAVHDATATLVGPGVEVDAELLVAIARACRDRLRVQFSYLRPDGERSERSVEPVQMVTTGRRWYLMAWDTAREDWRTFRLDRMHEVVASTLRFTPRAHPDPATYVQQSVSGSPYRHLARVRLRAPADRVRERVPPQVGRVEDGQDGWCVLEVGGDDLDWLAVHIAALGFEAEVLQPAELKAAAARLADRLAGIAMGLPPASR